MTELQEKILHTVGLLFFAMIAWFVAIALMEVPFFPVVILGVMLMVAIFVAVPTLVWFIWRKQHSMN